MPDCGKIVIRSDYKNRNAIRKIFWLQLHTWKVKIQMQLMNKRLWGIVNGTITLLTDPNKLLECESGDDKAKSITSLSLSNCEFHYIHMEK